MSKVSPPKAAAIAISLCAVAICTVPAGAKAGHDQNINMTEKNNLLSSSKLIRNILVHRPDQMLFAKPLLLAQEKAITTQRAPTRKLSSPQIKARWRYDTWRSDVVRKKLKNPDGTAQIPDTDCPPLPAQTCLDSWKDPNDDIANWPD